MFPFLLPFLPPAPQPCLLALSYLSSLIFNHFLYQMCSPSKPNSFLFPRHRPFGFLPLDLGLHGSFVMGTNGVPLSGSSPSTCTSGKPPSISRHAPHRYTDTPRWKSLFCHSSSIVSLSTFCFIMFIPTWPACCSVPQGSFSCCPFCLQERSAGLAHSSLPSCIQVSARLPPL